MLGSLNWDRCIGLVALAVAFYHAFCGLPAIATIWSHCTNRRAS